MPLRSCESRELAIDGVDVLIQANVDATPGTITILHAANDDAAQQALSDVRKFFGQEHRDMRVQTQQYKDGLPKVVDMCGNPATYSPPATAAPSPSQK